MNGIGSAAAKLTVFGVIVAACTGFIVTALRTPVPGDKVVYQAVFTDVSGLYEGDSVRMSGVAVGKVESVDLDRDRARVRFTVDRTRPVYDTTQAAVRYQNLIGQRYVELLTERPSAVKLPAGGVIPVERTIPSFDVSKLFNGFKPLFDTLEPEQLNQFGTNLLRVIQGDGSGIGPVLADLDRITAHARDSEAVIVLLIQNLGVVSQEIGGKSDAVGALVDQLSEILRQFTDRMQGVIAAIEKGDRVLTPLIPILEEGRDAYDVAYGPIDGLLRRLVPQTETLTQLLALTPGLVSGLNNAVPGEGYRPRITCSSGEAVVPDIGGVVLGSQNLVVCE
ncbi:virulence factor Mce family protein [Nocardia otitidiscaviarum]|uniref:Virulence factor Mce family protein n=1 Tax=Nocardia otitidiscaviarum TaxID=1823 RepID=A0A379JKC3_9NOCA|nr:MCE family protein [Nocardia otitidiscaviarum]SUD49109.1 virulence factor Mce family protein [Nocardia otitidiscaviarum]